MDRKQQQRLIAAIRDGLKRTGMSQKELARKGGTSAGQLSSALSSNGNMSPVKWQMCCEALGIDYAAVMQPPEGEHGEEKVWTRILPPEEEQSLSQASPDSSLCTREPERDEVAALAEKDKTIADLEDALNLAAKEHLSLRDENKTLKMDLSAVLDEGTKLKNALDTVQEKNGALQEENQQWGRTVDALEKEMAAKQIELAEAKTSLERAIGEMKARLAEEYDRKLQERTMKLKAALFDKEHPEMA